MLPVMQLKASERLRLLDLKKAERGEGIPAVSQKLVDMLMGALRCEAEGEEVKAYDVSCPQPAHAPLTGCTVAHPRPGRLATCPFHFHILKPSLDGLYTDTNIARQQDILFGGGALDFGWYASRPIVTPLTDPANEIGWELVQQGCILSSYNEPEIWAQNWTVLS